ncbi:unnamed protein product [Cuscuta campestris]|uniref:Uncharacterized protein n=1 Tax=Cuscuta campestris TaxID=132261 RepID=A0A484LIS5_9ASTE|nr:unnamed protein product [Cuscuta campestris]
MALILKSQANELIRLSGMAGTMKAEISLQEENGRLMDEVSEAKKTATPEITMESFRLLYREPEEKKDRIASHRVLLKRDPDFSAASYGLAPIPEEEPTPPFPLD